MLRIILVLSSIAVALLHASGGGLLKAVKPAGATSAAKDMQVDTW
jgi:hypothetical protein